MTRRRNSQTSSLRWLMPLVSTVTMPRSPVGGLLLGQHLGHGVDGVAVEGGLGVLEALDLEVGDGRPAHVGHAHPEHQGVHEVADDEGLAHGRLVLRVPVVGVRRVVVHGDHAEEVVVGLGDGLARPVAVDVADLEVLEVAAEGAVDHGHGALLLAGGCTARLDLVAQATRE